MTLWRRYDVWKFIANTILFREIKCKKMDTVDVLNLNVLSECGWNEVNIQE